MPRSGKCKSNLLNFDTGPIGPPLPTMPGFGVNLNINDLDIPFPEGFPENIFDLLNKLKLKFPGGIALNGILDNFMKKLSQVIANILTQISVFMALYNLLMAIVQMIVCIIEVLCGLVTGVGKKMRKLFRTCLPVFISIFPFMALIALILAILALILALIEYIVALIKKLIDELLRNFNNLKLALTSGNRPAALMIVRKVSSLLCILENILMLFMIVKTIIDIIKNMLNTSIALPCDSNDDSCSCDTCPQCAPILLSPEKALTTTASFEWKLEPAFIFGMPGTESVTMVATNALEDYRFIKLLGTVTGSGCPVGPFFPSQPLSYSTNTRKAPYLMDVGIPYTDGYGTREITIKDVFITWVSDSDPSGLLSLWGGVAEDGYDSVTGWTLPQVLRGYNTTPVPPIFPMDGYSVTTTGSVKDFRPNYDVLIAGGLCTADCIPEVKAEKDLLYSTIPETPQIDLPNIDLDAIDKAFSDLRGKINEDSINKFEADMTDILNKLKNDSETAYTQTLNYMVSPLYSTAELDPEIQFISHPIQVKVILRNINSQTFSDVMGDFPMPDVTAASLAGKIDAVATLGKVSSFTHDGYGSFIGTINSTEPGDGILKIFYDGQQFGQVIRPADLTTASEIRTLEFPYTFIGFGEGALGIVPGAPRRDETDTANRK